MRKALALLAFLVGFLPALAAAQAPPAVPALPDTERRTTYSPAASTCACSVGFALYGSSTDVDQWIQVYVNGTRYLSNDSTHGWGLTSATGSLATIPRPITNAVLTFTSAQTGTVQIVGGERPRRPNQFAENRGVAARDLNQAFTDLTAQNRETWDRSLRALLAPPGETIGLLPAQTTRAGGVLGFDSSGNPIAITALTGLGNVVGPNVSVVGHIATFGNTAGTILLDGGLVGAGDVTGPASSVDSHAATFSGTGGKTLKDSGLTLTSSTGTFTLTNAKTLAVTNTLTLSGTDSTTITFQGTDTYVGRATTDTLTNKTYDTAGTGNSFLINGLAATANTGTGAVVRATSPTLVTPVLGSASATSLQTAIVYPVIDSTTSFQIRKADATTRVVDVDTTNARVGINKTPGAFDLDVAGAVNGGAATFTSLNGLTVSTSTGTLTVANGKTLTVSNTGTIAGGDAFVLAIAAAKTLTVSNSLTFTGTDGTSFAFPNTSDTVVTLAATQTLTSKVLTAPTINGGTATALTSFGIRSSGTGAFDLTLANTENITAGRTLTLTLNNANRTVNLSGNLTLAAAFSTSGSSALTLTTTTTTNVTLPASGTLATQDVSNTFSSTNTFSALNQFTDIKLSSGKIYPTSDSTTALQITKADGTTAVVKIDTTNARVGINKTPGAFDLDTNGALNVGTTLTFTTLSSTSLGASTSTITGLTVNNSPSSSNDYLLYYSAADGAIRKATVGAIAAGATAGVSSLNGLTGGLSVVGGNGMTVSAVGTSVTVNHVPLTATYISSTGSQNYVTSASSNTSTIHKITLLGGGGGGGGVAQSVSFSTGGGGGSGGKVIFYCTGLAASTTVTFTIGAKGNGGAAGNNGGATGSNSTVTCNGTALTASGGVGGGGTAAGNGAKGNGGAATGGTVNVPGQAGSVGQTNGSNFLFGGFGGSNVLGAGGGMGVSADAAGNAATGCGAGGGGAADANAGAKAGGNGSDGCALIEVLN